MKSRLQTLRSQEKKKKKITPARNHADKKCRRQEITLSRQIELKVFRSQEIQLTANIYENRATS